MTDYRKNILKNNILQSLITVIIDDIFYNSKKINVKKNNKYTFNFLEELGRGSNCIAYRCEELNTKQEYIVKEFYPYSFQKSISRDEEKGIVVSDGFRDDYIEKVFKYQNSLMEHLNYYDEDTKNSISIPCAFCASMEGYIDSHFYFFKLQEGRILSDEINNNKQLSITDALIISYKLCDAMELIHKGINGENAYYLDCKPNNILVNDKINPFYRRKQIEWDVCLIDFDTLRSVSEIKNMKVGEYLSSSVGYSAPELIRGQSSNIGYYTDIYSIGAVLYRLLTGKTPYDETTNYSENIDFIKSLSIEDIILVDQYMDLNNDDFANGLIRLIEETLEPNCSKRELIFGNNADSTINCLKKKIEELIIKSNLNINIYDIKGKKSNKKKTKISKIELILLAIGIPILILGIVFALDFASQGKITYIMAKSFYYSEYASIKNQKISKQLFKISSDFNNADSYYFLGKIELRNNNNKEALNYFNEGYKKDSNLATIGLAEQYEKGNYGASLQQDILKAKELYEKAMENGSVEAKYCLAEMKRKGMVEQEENTYDEIEYYKESLGTNLPDFKANSYIRLGILANDSDTGKIDDKDAETYYIEAMDCFPQCTGDSYYLIASTYLGSKESEIEVSDYCKKAIEYYEEAAKQGDNRSMYIIGTIYEKDLIGQDYNIAYQYFEKASEMGNTDAMVKIGKMYKNGIVFKVNPDIAMQYFEKAKENGSSVAIDEIGKLYYNDMFSEDSVYYHEDNYSEALKWYGEAAIYGYGYGNYQVGYLYQYGKLEDGIDYSKAEEWYLRGEKVGDSACINALGIFYENGYLSEEKIIDEEKAQKYFQISAELGNEYAMYNLGKYYYNHKEYEEAEKWLKKAALNEHKSSMYYLGLIYENGLIDNNPDYENALYWFNKSALLGNEDSIYKLEDLYQKIDSDSINYQELISAYEVASENGNTYAMGMLARLYRSDKVGEKDPIKARDLYEKAINKGDYASMNNLGLMYAKGEFYGVVDYAMAKYWYEKAAENGSAVAMYNLGLGYEYGNYGEVDYKKSQQYFFEAAKYGYSSSIECLIDLFEEGKVENSVYKDYMVELGEIYENIENDFYDYELSKKCYNEAAKCNDAYAMYSLGYLYYSGKLNDGRNIPQAAYWYEKASENGSLAATDSLGFLYQFFYLENRSINIEEYTDKMREEDYDNAIKWYKKAADKGYYRSMISLGDISFAEQNYDDALKWYKLAYENCTDENKKNEINEKINNCSIYK